MTVTTGTTPGTAGGSTGAATVRRVLQRVVLPVDRDMDVLPLYVDPDRPELDVDKSGLTPAQRGKLPPTEPNAQQEPDPHAVLGRHSYRVRGQPADLVRHLLQRLRGELLAPLDGRRPRSRCTSR